MLLTNKKKRYLKDTPPVLEKQTFRTTIRSPRYNFDLLLL
jgi:hypothetical protein